MDKVQSVRLRPAQDPLLMFAIRRRWPVLTAVGAAVLYVANNYQISGLEHLQLKPLQRSTASSSINGNSQFSDPNAIGLGFDLTQFGIQSTGINGGFGTGFGNSQELGKFSFPGLAGQSSPAWSDQLSTGEKLALWQEKLAPAALGPSASPPTGPAFPTSSPIPFPHSLSSPGFSLPGTSPINRIDSVATHDVTASTPSVAAAAPNVIASPFATSPNAPPSLDTVPAGRVTSLTTGADLPLRGDAPTVAGQTLRVASFHVPGLGQSITNQPNASQLFAVILQQYDVIALQGIQTSRDDILPLIVDKLNQAGRKYDYLIGPRVGRSAPYQQFAYLFDTDKLETDRYQLYTVDDPEDLMNHEPLVAWFRCKGVPPQDAFTFSLINVNIDPSFADSERAMLPALIAAIEHDGRNEDDWILLGDFAGGNAHLTQLDNGSTRFAIRDMPTDVAGTQMLDSLIFSARATTEFTGRAGAFDFLRKYNLSLERALEVSSHMPIWAEFSCVEGAQPGRVAPVNIQ